MIRVYFPQRKKETFVNKKNNVAYVVLENPTKHEFILENIYVDDDEFSVDWSDLPKDEKGNFVVPPFSKQTVKLIWKKSAMNKVEPLNPEDLIFVDEKNVPVVNLDFGEVSEKKAEARTVIYLLNRTEKQIFLEEIISSDKNLILSPETNIIPPKQKIKVEVVWKLTKNVPLNAQITIKGYFEKKVEAKIKVEGTFKIKIP